MATENEMGGWHAQFSEHKLGQTVGTGDEQGSNNKLSSESLSHLLKAPFPPPSFPQTKLELSLPNSLCYLGPNIIVSTAARAIL